MVVLRGASSDAPPTGWARPTGLKPGAAVPMPGACVPRNAPGVGLIAAQAPM